MNKSFNIIKKFKVRYGWASGFINIKGKIFYR